MKMIRLVLTALIALVCAQIVCAADPLLVQVSCTGCSIKTPIPGGYEFRADVSKTIILTTSSTGGVGDKDYSWTKDGRIVCNFASFPITVTENVKYILTVTDDRGSVNKIVQIVPIFPREPKCLPYFRGGIILRDEIRGRTEYAAGDVFTLEIKLDRESCSDCPNYKFYWETDNPDIILVNPNSTKTEVKIKQGAKKSDAIVRAVITNGVPPVRDCEIDIEIVKNTPPQFKIEYSKPVYSHTRFEVWCVDFKPGERGESNDFLYRCSAVLKNETGRVVSSASRTASRGKISSLKLKPEGIEVCFIELTAYDSHLASTTVNETIQVVKGDTGKDIPIVRAPDVINCTVGEVCKIDTSETTRKDKDVSNFGFYNVATGERLVNPAGNYCSGPVCNHNFTYSGTYRIRIEANYFDEDNIGSKIVTVIVSPGNVSAMPTPVLTLTPIPTSIPVSVPTAIEESTVDKLETKRGLEKIFSDIMGLIDAIKNALK